jgi:hypothetical protein
MVCLLIEETCGDFTNEFLEINARRTTIAAAESVMIGNIRVSVKKIMCYKMSWLEKNFLVGSNYYIPKSSMLIPREF